MNIQELLGIKYPIIQGAMAGIADAVLASSVSNAGGLGIIASGGMSTEAVREEIRKCKTLTDKPFGVNVMLMAPNKDEIAKVLVEENVAVVTTGAGNPAPYIEMWKQARIKIIPVIANVKQAKKVESLGVDAVIAEGMEAGGHIGETTTMCLLPQVSDAVKIPVIAAGGIADGRAMKAVEILGAKGVQIGTLFLATEECKIHNNYKQAVINATDTDTVVTGRSLNNAVRCIKNPMTEKYIEIEKTMSDREELEKLTIGSLRKAVLEGDIENGSMMAGQICGKVNEIKTVKQTIEDLMTEYQQ